MLISAWKCYPHCLHYWFDAGASPHCSGNRMLLSRHCWVGMFCLWLKKKNPPTIAELVPQLRSAARPLAREKHGGKKVLKNTQIVFFSNSIYSPSGPKLLPSRGFNSLANTVFLLLLSIVTKRLWGKQWRRLGRQWVDYNKNSRNAAKFGEHVSFEVARELKSLDLHVFPWKIENISESYCPHHIHL